MLASDSSLIILLRTPPTTSCSIEKYGPEVVPPAVNLTLSGKCKPPPAFMLPVTFKTPPRES